MDIRSFFNSEYSKLQTSNNRFLEELDESGKVIQSQIKEFEQINSLLHGFLKTSKKEKKPDSKSVKEEKQLLSAVKSVEKLLTPKKQITSTISSVSKETRGTILLDSLKLNNVRFDKVVFNFAAPKQKESQSSENYNVSTSNELFDEKLKILKRIDDNLSKSPSLPGEEDTKESSGDFNIKSIISSMLAGSAASLLKYLKLPGLGKVGRVAGKFGKKALPIAGAVFSTYDLFKTVKVGVSDYKKFSKSGDYMAATNVLYSSLMGSLGNIINIAGAFLPPPLSFAALAVGTGIELLSTEMRETNGRTSGFVGESREKVAKTKKLIEVEQAKGEFVELRTNFKDPNNIFWEYNNGEDWVPMKDFGTGKYVPNMRNNNPIIPTKDPKKPGIQTYQISTKQGIRDIVMKNGQLYMNVPNVGLLPISTRKQGGSVVKNKTYLVGERNAESYVPNKQNEIIKELQKKDKKNFDKNIEKIDNSFKMFETDIRSIRNYFSKDVRGNTIQPRTDATMTQSGPIPGKEYPTMNLPQEAKTKFGERYAKVKSPLMNASEKIGIPLKILVKFAHVESSLVTKAGAKTSSARGLFQFVGNTWKHMVGKYGKQYGVKHDSVEDPTANSLMGALYIKENMNILKNKGLEITDQNLYLLHFLGPGAGPKLIKAVSENPNAIASKLFPSQAKSNKNVFYSDSGIAKTVRDVYDWAGKKMTVDVSYMNSFDVGSWKLNNDQEAFIHKGEMIIPEYHANKIRAAVNSGKIEITKPQEVKVYDIYSDASFWINTFMPALANVVISEFGGENG